jgi:O-antigen/teichoic acid export membrane protein
MLYGAISTGVRMGANILLLPFVLALLSPAELALWWVFVALGAIGTLADFGFGAAFTRVYSYLWAGADDFDTVGLRAPQSHGAPNLPRLRQLNVTARLLYHRLAWAATGIVALGGTAFLWDTLARAGHPLSLWISWALYVAAIGTALGTSYWNYACQGVDRMRPLQASYMWSGVGYLVVAAGMLAAGAGLFSMVMATAVRTVVGRELCRRAYREAVPKTIEPSPDPGILRKLWPNAWKFGVLSIGVYLINHGSVLICSHFLGEATTASYGVTVQVGAFLVGFSSLWLTVKWPQITILRAQGRSREMAALFARRLACTTGTFVILAAILVLLGNHLLEWKGTQTRLLPTAQLVVYLIYLGQQQLFAQFGSLTFTENVVPFFKLSLFTGLGLMVLSLWMTPTYGVWGLILAPLLAMLVASSWYPIWRGFQGQPLTIGQFVRAAMGGKGWA